MTFGKKIGLSFAVCFLLLFAIGAVAYRSTETLVETSKQVTHTHQVLEHIVDLYSLLRDAETGQRGYVITKDENYLSPYVAALAALPKEQQALRELVSHDDSQTPYLDQIDRLIASKLDELHRTIELRRNVSFEATQKLVMTNEGKQYMDELRHVLDQMDKQERDNLRARAEEVDRTAAATRATITLGTLLCLFLVTVMGVLLTRSLSNQIGQAVHHIQSSSSELQSSANQQVMGARETSTSISEIATTISELLATSRQIADSAARVSSFGGQMVGSARTGEGTVQAANESILGIRRQMDRVVDHMLELGKKSQQIGTVLDIVSELAEQTNILAINATIEAAGAGESGKRFSVVADEIRKLADRVAGSTKEIRGLIEDVRGAVNTTVMATETGSKAVDSGSRQFSEVAVSFKQIVTLVATTTEASREIELSTQQQTSAVEQVNVAISNVAQATKETEASSAQTLETASQLVSLSKELLRIVQPQS